LFDHSNNILYGLKITQFLTVQFLPTPPLSSPS